MVFFIVVFVINWKFLFICLCIVFVIILVMFIVVMVYVGYEIKILDIYLQVNFFVEGVFVSVKIVYVFGMREWLVERFNNYFDEVGVWGCKILLLFGILMLVEYSIIFLGMVFVFW